MSIIRYVRYSPKVLGIFQTNNRLFPILHITFNYLRINAIFHPISLNPACNTIVNAEKRSKVSSRSFVGDTRYFVDFTQFYVLVGIGNANKSSNSLIIVYIQLMPSL